MCIMWSLLHTKIRGAWSHFRKVPMKGMALASLDWLGNRGQLGGCALSLSTLQPLPLHSRLSLWRCPLQFSHVLLHFPLRKGCLGTSLVVQGLRLCTPHARGPGLILAWGMRSFMLQLKVPPAKTKTWRSHINKEILQKKKKKKDCWVQSPRLS